MKAGRRPIRAQIGPNEQHSHAGSADLHEPIGECRFRNDIRILDRLIQLRRASCRPVFAITSRTSTSRVRSRPGNHHAPECRKPDSRQCAAQQRSSPPQWGSQQFLETSQPFRLLLRLVKLLRLLLPLLRLFHPRQNHKRQKRGQYADEISVCANSRPTIDADARGHPNAQITLDE